MATAPSPLGQHASPWLEPGLKPDARGHRDNWFGLASADERRKIQNRINARAYRRRKKAISEAALASRGLIIRDATATEDANTSDQSIESARRANFRTQGCSPSTDLLLNLVYSNTWRAYLSNAALLGYDPKDVCAKHLDSTFIQGGSEEHLPVDLRPTRTQRMMAHHFMVDIFPDPNLRDQLIKTMNLIDAQEICIDLMGDPWGLAGPAGLQGLVVWGEPYLISSWEITEAFYGKWHFLVSGSAELIKSSNRWRAVRGEAPLRVEELS